ncbi:phosphopentomutase-like [Amphiura filiformis]|uniref:phosphopentomutase-like n=1 Tax=Amphiura filiformis TaxID=82378 RepID=UPI003B21C3BA
MASECDTSDPVLDKKVKQWLAWDKNVITREEVLELVQGKKLKELHARFDKHIEFGTAGLRAGMEAGPARMNDLTVIQASQGLLRHLEAVNPDCKTQGVVIGYDARHNSKRFAALTSAVMLHAGVPVFLFSNIVPTPFVPYTIKKYGCAAGVMVTSSHNPKGDNGYKVYWGNGAQIIPPHDKGIANHINQNLEPWPNSWDTSIVESSPLKRDLLEEVEKVYTNDLQKKCLHRSINQSTKLRFTYTAMHGVGTRFVQMAVEAFGLPPLVLVKEQVEPDPEFPTVKYPNPEEGKSALDLAQKTADENNSTVILANDPDADRFALAEKQKDGSWKIFSGNEVGALLGWWLFFCYKEKEQNYNGDDVYMVASTVSSKILQAIGKKEGFHFEETLTGFKWMANKANDLTQDGKTVLFAFEEAIGFMCGIEVLDKDGVATAVIVAEMAAYLATINTTCTEQLQEIYKIYGYHCSNNSYFLCLHPPTITSIFERIQKFENGHYPSSCGQYKIRGIRDLNTGYDSNQPNKQAVLPVSKSSQMITFTFENGCVATLRTSGTEPKIKYYTEMCADPSRSDRDKIKEELDAVVQALVDNFLEPEKNKLIPKGK